jgi:hypothetical protein
VSDRQISAPDNGPWTDCRNVSVGDPSAPWNQSDGLRGVQPLLNGWQVAALGGAGFARQEWLIRAPVTVPDFLTYARLLSTGQAGQVARMPGSIVRVALAGLRVAPSVLRHPLRAAKKDFWVVAGTLLRYDLALLPAWHCGPVLLHAQVFDMALALDHRDFVRQALAVMARGGRQVGVHTQQLPAALSCLERWRCRLDVLSALWLHGDRDGRMALQSARLGGGFQGVSLVAEATCHPLDLAGGGEELLLGEEGAGLAPDRWVLPAATLRVSPVA